MAEEQGLLDGEGLESQLSEQISNYIHGPAREQVIESVRDGQQELGQTLAAIAYRIVRETADQLEQSDPGLLEMDLMLRLATETIDYLLEIADALGIQYDPDGVRQESLIEMVALHMEQVGDDPRQKAMAEDALNEMLADGTYQQAMREAEQMMRQQGVDPAQAAQMGEQMAMGQRNQVSQGVEQGLLDQQGGMQR